MVSVSLANQLERLVLFTRYPEPGRTKTRLIPALGPNGASDLQKHMTEHVPSRVRDIVESRPVDMEVRYEGGKQGLMEKWLAKVSHIDPKAVVIWAHV